MTGICMAPGTTVDNRLFADTSAWFAFANRTDPQHANVVGALKAFPGRIVTPNFILDEAVSLCLFRLGHQVAMAFGPVLMDPNEADLVRVAAEDEHAAWRLFCTRSDQSYSFTDCTSFVVMRRLGLSKALALDADFSTEGFEVVPAIL